MSQLITYGLGNDSLITNGLSTDIIVTAEVLRYVGRGGNKDYKRKIKIIFQLANDEKSKKTIVINDLKELAGYKIKVREKEIDLKKINIYLKELQTEDKKINFIIRENNEEIKSK